MSEPKKVIVISGQQLVIAVLSIFVSVASMVGASMLYMNYVDRKSNHVLCELFTGLDKRYSKLPPTADPDALEFARQIHSIVVQYDC